MNGTEYQKLAMRTCSIPEDKPGDRLFHGLFGLAAEAGEVLSIYQKEYQGHYEPNADHLKKELGDALWMIAEICDASGFTLDEVMEMNIEKLRKRYPQGFEAERSLHRADGDI